MMNSAEERFKEFVNELEKLSKKTGVVIHSTGGVTILDEEIDSVEYSTDPTSGDLEYYLKTKEPEPTNTVSKTYKFTPRQLDLLEDVLSDLGKEWSLPDKKSLRNEDIFHFSISLLNAFLGNSSHSNTLRVVNSLIDKGVFYSDEDGYSYIIENDFLKKFPDDFRFSEDSFKKRYKEKNSIIQE